MDATTCYMLTVPYLKLFTLTNACKNIVYVITYFEVVHKVYHNVTVAQTNNLELPAYHLLTYMFLMAYKFRVLFLMAMVKMK